MTLHLLQHRRLKHTFEFRLVPDRNCYQLSICSYQLITNIRKDWLTSKIRNLTATITLHTFSRQHGLHPLRANCSHRFPGSISYRKAIITLSSSYSWLDQWYSTWGTRRYLRGYVKLKIYILFHDKHWIIRARFRVSHKTPGRKDMRFGTAIFLSLSLSFMRFLSGRLVSFHST
jgi:hypothetical protein